MRALVGKFSGANSESDVRKCEDLEFVDCSDSGSGFVRQESEKRDF